MTTLAVICTLLCFLALGMAIANRRQFLRPPLPDQPAALPPVSVLIPARNEENNIAAAVESALDSAFVEVEVIVLDDHSSDKTRQIVESIAQRDPRVKVHSSKPLPEGWSGKQYACYQLSQLASYKHFLFLDADVRLHRECLARVVGELQRKNLALLSGFPRQITKTPLEWLLLPLIHFVLLGYLPFARMRSSNSPAASAGCGQFFLTTRNAYQATGGHSSIRSSSHDGVQLPRAYRRQGQRTDLCDITLDAEVRMYQNASEVWFGLSKNATEGIGNPRTIIPMTILLGAQIVPFVALPITLALGHSTASLLFTLASLCALTTRLILSRPFQLPLRSALLHPIGLATLLLIQYQAILKKLTGQTTNWKGRQV